MITASKISLAAKCLGAFTLPGISEVHGGQTDGVEAHADHEEAIESGNVPEILTERWPGYSWRAEVSYAVDVSTGVGRVLGVGLHRAYDTPGGLVAFGIPPLAPFEVSGTADAEGRGPKGELVIVDWKSFDPLVARAAKNAQLHTLALAATRAYGLDECEVAISHKLRPFDVAPLGPIDFDVFEMELRRIFEAVAKARSDARDGRPATLVPGQHCRYCPAFIGPQGVACPAQQKLALDMGSEDTAMSLEKRIPFENDEDAAQAFDLLSRIKMLTARLTSALYARAGERPIPLADGRVLGPVQKLGNERLDGDEVFRVVRDQIGIGVADLAVSRVASKVKLREALKGAARRGSVAELERKILDEVRKRGGAKREMKTVIEVHDAEIKTLPQGAP